MENSGFLEDHACFDYLLVEKTPSEERSCIDRISPSSAQDGVTSKSHDGLPSKSVDINSVKYVAFEVSQNKTVRNLCFKFVPFDDLKTFI